MQSATPKSGINVLPCHTGNVGVGLLKRRLGFSFGVGRHEDFPIELRQLGHQLINPVRGFFLISRPPVKFGIEILEHLIVVKLLCVKIEDHFLSIIEDGVEMPSTVGHNLAEKSNSFHACRESVRKL